ncbi:uncharacterized protein [Battus philenor]|uniref:uncharacterized protein n=1 Tax=Battus philenor TaxID=42288 RepID=UPI0035CF9401
MALMNLYLSILITLSKTISSNAVSNVSSVMPPVVKTILDPKRRSDLVDEAFLEQKDVLLDMLEAKLKEVRDKKKRKNDRGDNTNNNYANNHVDNVRCDQMPKNVDLNLNAHGVSAIGEADVKLKFGDSGNGTLNLDATGISNIGQTHVDMAVGDGTVYIPGLNNIFVGASFLKNPCLKSNLTNTSPSTPAQNPVLIELKEDRRKMSNNSLTANVTNSTSKDINSIVGLNSNNTDKEKSDIKQINSTATSTVVAITSVISTAATSPST